MSTNVCAQCGEANAPEGRFCRRCGAPLAQPAMAPAPPAATTFGQDYHAAPAYGATPAPYAAPVSGEVADAQKTARNSLIVGLVGLVCLGFILGFLAIKYGVDARKRLTAAGVSQGRGMALAGIILGVFDILGSIVSLLVAISTR